MKEKYNSFSKKDLKKLDIKTIELEVEALNGRINQIVTQGQQVSPKGKKRFDLTKNEIVHEYLYDSEEESIML